MLETMSECLLRKIYQSPCKYHKNKCEEKTCCLLQISKISCIFAGLN